MKPHKSTTTNLGVVMWSHEEELIWVSEVEKNVSETASYTPEPLEEIVEYTYTTSSNWHDKLTVSIGANGVTVSAASLAGLFRPVHIKAKDMDTNEELTFYDWDKIPEGLEIFDFKPQGNPLVMSVAVTAKVVTTPELPEEPEEIEYTQSLQIVIEPDYSAGRDALNQYVSWSKLQALEVS